jgi:hypothetical protein
MVPRRASAVFTMLRIDRFSQRLLWLWALSALPQLGCTLITDVDRSKIPAPEVILPDPEPPATDAGAADAGNLQPEPADGGSDAAPAEPDPDAGSVELSDAQAPDGG